MTNAEQIRALDRIEKNTPKYGEYTGGWQSDNDFKTIRQAIAEMLADNERLSADYKELLEMAANQIHTAVDGLVECLEYNLEQIQNSFVGAPIDTEACHAYAIEVSKNQDLANQCLQALANYKKVSDE